MTNIALTCFQTQQPSIPHLCAINSKYERYCMKTKMHLFPPQQNQATCSLSDG